MEQLDEKTIADNARFFDNIDEVPKSAITMGIGTIMDAKKIILLANKENKADAVVKTVEGPVTPDVPASILQKHADATIIVDEPASSKLTK